MVHIRNIHITKFRITKSIISTEKVIDTGINIIPTTYHKHTSYTIQVMLKRVHCQHYLFLQQTLNQLLCYHYQIIDYQIIYHHLTNWVFPYYPWCDYISKRKSNTQRQVINYVMFWIFTTLHFIYHSDYDVTSLPRFFYFTY